MSDASEKVVVVEQGAADSGLMRELLPARFLAEASQVLAGSLDLERTMTSLARLTVPVLADFCLIDVIEDGTIRRVAGAHADPSLDEVVQTLVTRPAFNTPSSGPLEQAVRSGALVMIETADPDVLTGMAGEPESLPILRRLAPSAVLFAPLVTGNRTSGLLELYLTAPRRSHSPEQMHLAEELARQAVPSMQSARLYQEAQHAVRMREEILAVVSHDLRNPLSRIYLATDQLQRVVAPEHARHVEIIRRSAQHMNRLIQDLLEITKLEAGQLALDRRWQDIRTILREAVDMVAPRMEQKNLHLDESIDEAIPSLAVDRVRIVQVLSNLFDNAIRHTPEGGRIGIGAHAEASEVVLTVQDSGSGIDPTLVPQLFNRYRRTKRFSREGVGLGLAIARGIVEAHGGRISVDTAVGQGSTFKIYLPNDPVPSTAAARP